jgi:hypothetical protein
MQLWWEIAALRHFGPAYDGFGSKAVVQGCPTPVRHSPQYPSKQTIQGRTGMALECHERL